LCSRISRWDSDRLRGVTPAGNSAVTVTQGCLSRDFDCSQYSSASTCDQSLRACTHSIVPW
jgi:hypothetical protein